MSECNDKMIMRSSVLKVPFRAVMRYRDLSCARFAAAIIKKITHCHNYHELAPSGSDKKSKSDGQAGTNPGLPGQKPERIPFEHRSIREKMTIP